MAARLALKGGKLPHVWNVSGRVGPGSDEPNFATDVELLSTLVVMALNHPSVRRFAIKGTLVPPSQSSVFNPVLGFWLFRFQQIGRHQATDGVASPARGMFFAPGHQWVVVTLNELARETDPEMWAGLNQNHTLSAGLRAELSR